jgi:hypothetical protein
MMNVSIFGQIFGNIFWPKFWQIINNLSHFFGKERETLTIYHVGLIDAKLVLCNILSFHTSMNFIVFDNI